MTMLQTKTFLAQRLSRGWPQLDARFSRSHVAGLWKWGSEWERDWGSGKCGGADKCASSNSASCQLSWRIFGIIEVEQCVLQYNNAEGHNTKSLKWDKGGIRTQQQVVDLFSGCPAAGGGSETVYLSSVLKTGGGPVPSPRSTCDVRHRLL